MSEEIVFDMDATVLLMVVGLLFVIKQAYKHTKVRTLKA